MAGPTDRRSDHRPWSWSMDQNPQNPSSEVDLRTDKMSHHSIDGPSSLDMINKCVAEQLVCGGIMQQPLEIASALLDGMTKINRAWHRREDRVSSLTFRMMKEHIEKDQERDQNMAKMMNQLDLLSKNVIGSGTRALNIIGVSGANPNDAHFEALYNEEDENLKLCENEQ
uniref:Uncharacterized protein n=1 Tax=Solanum tuberosum TaxID=4113 RepID=M1DDD8_SOLTU